jgi:hypothetical protein
MISIQVINGLKFYFSYLEVKNEDQMNELLPARTRFIIVLLRSLSYCSLSCIDILDSFFLLVEN